MILENLIIYASVVILLTIITFFFFLLKKEKDGIIDYKPRKLKPWEAKVVFAIKLAGLLTMIGLFFLQLELKVKIFIGIAAVVLAVDTLDRYDKFHINKMIVLSLIVMLFIFSFFT